MPQQARCAAHYGENVSDNPRRNILISALHFVPRLLAPPGAVMFYLFGARAATLLWRGVCRLFTTWIISGAVLPSAALGPCGRPVLAEGRVASSGLATVFRAFGPFNQRVSAFISGSKDSRLRTPALSSFEEERGNHWVGRFPRVARCEPDRPSAQLRADGAARRPYQRANFRCSVGAPSMGFKLIAKQEVTSPVS